MSALKQELCLGCLPHVASAELGVKHRTTEVQPRLCLLCPGCLRLAAGEGWYYRCSDGLRREHSQGTKSPQKASRLYAQLGLQCSCVIFRIPCLSPVFLFLAQIFKKKNRTDRLTASGWGTFKGKYMGKNYE